MLSRNLPVLHTSWCNGLHDVGVPCASSGITVIPGVTVWVSARADGTRYIVVDQPGRCDDLPLMGSTTEG